MKKTCLITGGAGFIGSHIVEKFVNDDYKIIVIDNLFRGKLENIQRFIDSGNVDFYKIDLTTDQSKTEMAEIISKCRPEIIMHYAAINGTQYFYDIPHQVVEVNSIGTINLMKAIQQSIDSEKFQPLIMFASTSETYGEPFNLPTGEKDITYFRIEQDRDSYAVAKMVSEFYVKLFCQTMGLKWLILRIFNVYGPKMVGTKYGQVIPEFVSRIDQGEYPLKILGDGSHKRSFIHINDHVELTHRLIHSSKLKTNEVYNLGNDKEISIAELGKKIMELKGMDPKIEFMPERSGDHKRRVPDISKLLEVIGPYQFKSLEDGLTELIHSE